MKFTDDFIELPILAIPNDVLGGAEMPAIIKILPSHIYGYLAIPPGGGVAVSYAGFGVIHLNLTIEDFEKKINDFVGNPVSAAEKALAIQQRFLDNLEKQ